jgi:integrase
VGRKRQNESGLPPRVYEHHTGGFIYRPKNGPSLMLEAKSALEAITEHGRLTKTGVIPRTAIPGGVTIGSLVDHYKLKELHKLSPITIEDYEPGLDRIKLTLGDLPPGALKPKDLYAFIDGVTQADGARNLYISLLRNLYKIALKKGACDVNPARELQKETPGRRNRVPSLDDLRVFTEEGGPWWNCYITMKLLTGLRQNDLLALPPIDPDTDTFSIEMSKSRRWSKDEGRRVGRTQTYVIDAALRATLRAVYALPRPRRADVLFCSTRGNRIRSNVLRRAFRAVLARVVARGVQPFREHDVRATVATLDRVNAQRRLGHKHQGTTDLYIRQLEGEVVMPLDLETARKTEKDRKTGQNIHQLSVAKA